MSPVRLFARTFFVSFFPHTRVPVAAHRFAFSALASHMDAPAEHDYESAGPIEGRGRGRGRGGLRGRGRGRPRGRGRGRGAAARIDDGEPYELETTASIVEIVETDELPVHEEADGGVEETTRTEGERGRRSRGRGRGRWSRRRGRGRGRGAAPAEDGRAEPGEGEQATGLSESRPPIRRRERPPRQRLTHFISLPIGHHSALQQTISSFTDALLAADPAISGLDPTVVIHPRRLHLTLGVMSLHKNSESSSVPAASDVQEQSNTTEKPTLASAIAHLESLKPKITELLAGQKLRVELGVVDIMPSGKASLDRASVMWAGPPKEGQLAERLKTVGTFISESFKAAGFLADEDRPLRLHCTILNTIYRKPRPKGRSYFSYSSVLTSDALRAIALEPDTLHAPLAPAGASGGNEEIVNTENDARDPAADADTSGKGKEKARSLGRREPVRVNLGVWDVDEVQICEMGSHGPEDEYVCVGKIALL